MLRKGLSGGGLDELAKEVVEGEGCATHTDGTEGAEEDHEELDGLHEDLVGVSSDGKLLVVRFLEDERSLFRDIDFDLDLCVVGLVAPCGGRRARIPTHGSKGGSEEGCVEWVCLFGVRGEEGKDGCCSFSTRRKRKMKSKAKETQNATLNALCLARFFFCLCVLYRASSCVAFL